MMRFFIPIFLWLALPCWAFSQSSATIDSLINFIAHRTQKDSLYIDALNRLAYQYYVDNPKKLELAYQARILAIEINYPKGEAEAYRQMGMVAWGQSNYPLALKHFFDGLKIAEDSHDLQRIADITGNIGLVYQGLGDFSQALTFQEKSLLMQRKAKNKLRESVALNNLGNIKRVQKEYSAAIAYYKQSRALSEDVHNLNGQAASILNLGKIYEEREMFDTALQYYFESTRIYEMLKERRGMTQCRQATASAYFNMKLYDKAKQFANESLAIARQGHFKAFIRDAYLLLYQISEAQHDINSSFDFFRLYSSSKDSVMNLKVASEIAAQRLEYETQKKQSEIDLLKKEADVHQIIISKKNSLLLFIGITLFLLFSLTLMLFKNYSQQKSINRILKNKNEEIKKHHAEITEQHDQLIALNTTLQAHQEEARANRDELAKKNASIAEMNKRVLEINENLERTIVERTSALKRQNQHLIEYSFINANKLKAPLARILGLINLLNITNNREQQKDLITFLHQASSEFDGVTRSINQVVEDGLDAYKKQPS